MLSFLTQLRNRSRSHSEDDPVRTEDTELVVTVPVVVTPDHRSRIGHVSDERSEERWVERWVERARGGRGEPIGGSVRKTETFEDGICAVAATIPPPVFRKHVREPEVGGRVRCKRTDDVKRRSCR
jgi:hypothetical protein